MGAKTVLKTILIVDNSTWNIYNFRMPHISTLKANGYRVLVATPIDEYIGKLNNGAYDRFLPLHHLFPQSKNPLQDLLFFWELIRLYQKYRPDLVIHFTIKPNLFGSLATRFLKIPAISIMTGLGYPFLHPSGFYRLLPPLLRFAFRRLQKLVVYNAGDKSLLVGQKIIAAEKCAIIPGSGINTNYFRPLSRKLDNQGFVFLYIGRLLKDKGLIEYVQAAKRLKTRYHQIEFWVIGNFTHTNPSAVDKDQLFDWVESGDIKYFGFADDVRHYLKNTDVMVLPSKREGLSRSVLEAMSMEKPIITTRAAGCREAVEHGVNGFLVPEGNANALADAMETLYLASPASRQEMGQASRQRVLDRFDEKLIAASFLSLVKSILPLEENDLQRADRPPVF